ncbi:MAG: hypothetical protein MJ093_06880 [Saccharofermentans sp.]|nr:hypothetical protein [Saccharofermentans sp.]
MSSFIYLCLSYLLAFAPFVICLVWRIIVRNNLKKIPKENRTFWMKLNSALSMFIFILSIFWALFIYLGIKIMESM